MRLTFRLAGAVILVVGIGFLAILALKAVGLGGFWDLAMDQISTADNSIQNSRSIDGKVRQIEESIRGLEGDLRDVLESLARTEVKRDKHQASFEALESQYKDTLGLVAYGFEKLKALPANAEYVTVNAKRVTMSEAVEDLKAHKNRAEQLAVSIEKEKTILLSCNANIEKARLESAKLKDETSLLRKELETAVIQAETKKVLNDLASINENVVGIRSRSANTVADIRAQIADLSEPEDIKARIRELASPSIDWRAEMSGLSGNQLDEIGKFLEKANRPSEPAPASPAAPSNL